MILKAATRNILVTNRGIGGETTCGLKNRLDVSVLELKPKICVMLIGGNNIDTAFLDYEDILYTLDGAHHTTEDYRVITGCIKPVIDKLMKGE